MAAKITIDGREYPLPDFRDMTMGGARIVKRYTGLTLNEVENADPSDPDLIASFCHLAILAENPGAAFAQIEEQVNSIRFAALEFSADEEEVEASPPAPTQNENGSELPGSGDHSTPTSDAIPATIQLPTGAVR